MQNVHEGTDGDKPQNKAAHRTVPPLTAASLVAEFMQADGSIEGRHRAALVEALVAEPKQLEMLAAIADEAKKKATKSPGSKKMRGRPMSSFVDEILDFAKRPRLSFGLPELDARAPWPVGSICTLIGPTGRGKTSLALQIAAHHAGTMGPCVIVSAELAGVVLAARRASQMSQAAWLDVLSGALPRHDLERALNCPDLYVIDDVDEQWVDHVADYMAYFRKTRSGRVPMVLADYVQILPAPGDDDQARTKWTMQALNEDIAKPFDAGVLAISKTARTNSKALRAGEAIGADTTEAGAESNAIEYYSAVQLALGQLVESDEGDTMECNVSKARFGRGDAVVPLQYDGAHGWFRPGGEGKSSAEVRTERKLAAGNAKLKAKRDAIVAFLAGVPEASGMQIRKEVGGRNEIVQRLLQDLVRDGLLEQHVSAGGNASNRYVLKRSESR